MIPKSLLHCHSKNLHSVIIGKDVNDNLIRMFVATKKHTLYKNSLLFLSKLGHSQELAIHSHKSDITLIPLTGTVYNITASKILENEDIEENIALFRQYEYHSPILNEKGKFVELSGIEKLKLIRTQITRSLHLPSSTLHTIYIPEYTEASWLVVEGKYSSTPSLISYSNNDLTVWNDSELYQEMDKETEQKLIDQYFHNIKPNEEIQKDNIKIYEELDFLLKEYTQRLHYSYEELYTKYSEIYTSIKNEVNNGGIHSNRYSEKYIPTKALAEFKTFLNNSINIK